MTERWREQPSPYTPASAVQLSDVLVAGKADPAVVRLSIYRQCRESKRTLPPRAVNYFRPGIEDDLAVAKARANVAASGEQPPPSNGASPARTRARAKTETAGDRSYADADAAFAAAGITPSEEDPS